ncbi:MAG: hypothetical protein F4199_10485 [Rhodothermaceae bacterium]|nr:hypothetical protein [Rhodothermaceae bacterium]
MSTGLTSEEVFNTRFVEALRSTSALWSENKDYVSVEPLRTGRGGSKKPDIIINDYSNPPLIIETSFDARDADKDAVEKLKHHLKHSYHKTYAAVALHIPAVFRYTSDHSIPEVLLDGAEVGYSVHRKTKNGGGALAGKRFREGDNLRPQGIIASPRAPLR